MLSQSDTVATLMGPIDITRQVIKKGRIKHIDTHTHTVML